MLWRHCTAEFTSNTAIFCLSSSTSACDMLMRLSGALS